MIIQLQKMVRKKELAGAKDTADMATQGALQEIFLNHI